MVLTSAEFGRRLREERVRLRLNQTDAASRLCVGRSALVSYETGKSAPSVLMLPAAEAAGFDTWYLLTGERHDRAAIERIDWPLFVNLYRVVAVTARSSGRALNGETQVEAIRTIYRILCGAESRHAEIASLFALMSPEEEAVDNNRVVPGLSKTLKKSG